MRPRWLEERNGSLGRRLLLLPLALLAVPMAMGARLHRALYRLGVLRATRLPCHVVSVGNLVVGGSAKTPLAAWLACALAERGHRVALASRGYGGRGAGAVEVVSDGRFVRGQARVVGEEALLLAAHAPGVPVLVGRNRARVGLRALASFGADLLVLDDGFQHHRLHRDVDLVNCDAAFGFGNRWVLPRGPLREPTGALRHAHAIGVIDGPLAAPDAALVDRVAPVAYRFRVRRRPLSLRPLAGGDALAPDRLSGSEVGMLAAIANPSGFRRMLESLGMRVVAEALFRDHHRYRPADLRDLARRAALWVTTEKDAVKLVPSWAGAADVRVLRIALDVEEPEKLLDWIESRLR